MIKTVFIAAAIMLCGCSYDELPPKTDDATTDYILPKGTMPSAEETEYVKAIRAEYNEAAGTEQKP